MNVPSRKIYRETLSNGQVLTVWFYRFRSRPVEPWAISYPDTKIAHIWRVAIYIGTKEEAERWIKTPYKQRIKRIKQTGVCGLEGMRRALECVIRHCEGMGEREELHIICEDAKRYRAYRWLIRHFNGFTDYVGDDGGMAIGFRHPNWWVWKTKEELNC
jgi:hypothetical protein